MYIENLTQGSVLLPNGLDLVTWMEVTAEEAESLKKYDGTLLKISSTKPLGLGKASVALPVEEDATQGGSASLSDLVKPAEEPVIEAAVPVDAAADAPAETEKKSSKKKA